MIVNKQKPIKFNNSCQCKCNLKDLEKAILWYQDKPTTSNKKIYMHGNYPAVSINSKKIHVHRLLMKYWTNSNLDNKYVHHKNEDKLDATRSNLKIMNISKHQSKHNKNKTISDEHKKKIIEANKKRKGTKIAKHRKDITYKKVHNLYKQGNSINKISKILDADWTTIKNRLKDINENPELLESD